MPKNLCKMNKNFAASDGLKLNGSKSTQGVSFSADERS